MKKQVVIIHGGDTYNSYEEYLSDLKKQRPGREDFVPSPDTGWKDALPGVLGLEYEVFLPEMPNWMNARYAEWKIWFDKLLPFLGADVAFVGHSLGGIFLAKYFAENDVMKKTKGVFLVAPPYGTAQEDHMADFVVPKDLSRLAELGPRLHLYASEDDPVVSFEDFKTYAKLLPEARATIFKDHGHFRQPEFPEIVKDIQGAFL